MSDCKNVFAIPFSLNKNDLKFCVMDVDDENGQPASRIRFFGKVYRLNYIDSQTMMAHYCITDDNCKRVMVEQSDVRLNPYRVNESDAPNDVPATVSLSKMRRDWWIAHVWYNISAYSESEPVYVRGPVRPIEEVEAAGREFDSAREANHRLHWHIVDGKWRLLQRRGDEYYTDGRLEKRP